VSTTNVTKARQNLFRLIDQVNDDHEPVLITGKKGSAVLISESDWKAIEETLYLNSIPELATSIQEGMNTPTSEMDDTIEWE
jgi:prevent-host-death family protein